MELAQYADDTALVATSNHLTLLVKYLKTHLSELEKMALRLEDCDQCRDECSCNYYD